MSSAAPPAYSPSIIMTISVFRQAYAVYYLPTNHSQFTFVAHSRDLYKGSTLDTDVEYGLQYQRISRLPLRSNLMRTNHQILCGLVWRAWHGKHAC